MENRRSFKQIKQEMYTLKKFESFAKKVAKEYANSELHFSASYFSERYNISKDCFYKLLNEAIVRGLVSEKEVDMMEQKAIANQKVNHSTAGATTKKKYAKLRIERNKYMCLYGYRKT